MNKLTIFVFSEFISDVQSFFVAELAKVVSDLINGFAAVIEFIFAQIFFKLFLNIIKFCLLNCKVQAYGLFHFLKRVKMPPFDIVFRARQPLKVVGVDEILVVLFSLNAIFPSDTFA